MNMNSRTKKYLNKDALSRYPQEFQTTIWKHLGEAYGIGVTKVLFLAMFAVLLREANSPTPIAIAVLFVAVWTKITEKKTTQETVILFMWKVPLFLLSLLWEIISSLRLFFFRLIRILSSSFQAPGFETPVSLVTDEKELFSGDSSSITVAHFSDLHITNSRLTPTTEGAASPNQTFKNLIARNIHTLKQCDLVVFTGDITDSGQVEEWNNFIDAVHPLVELDVRLVITPGNHDLNRTSSRQKLIAEKAWSPARAVRLLRFIKAFAIIDGRSIMRSGLETLRLFTDTPRYRAVQEVIDNWTPYNKNSWTECVKHAEVVEKSAFPLFGYADKKVAYAIFNSNAKTGSILNNALGEITVDQLTSFGNARNHWMAPTNDFNLVFMHHHPAKTVPPRTKSFFKLIYSRFLQSSMMTLLNSQEVLSALKKIDNVVVFHGHKHLASRYMTSEGIPIVASHSSTLGCESGNIGPGFFIIQLARKNGRTEFAKEMYFEPC